MLARVLNYILYVLGLLIAVSGLILEWKFPHGAAGKSVGLWGLGKGMWKDIHLWGGIVLCFLVVWHLWLHRKWLVNYACKKSSAKMWLGLLVPVAILTAASLSPLAEIPAGSGGCSGGSCATCPDRSTCGEGKSSCGEKKSSCGEKKSSCGEKKSSCGEKKSSCGEKKSSCGEKKSSCGEKKFSCGEKKSSCGEKKSSCGENATAELPAAGVEAGDASAQPAAVEAE
ncbi:DUF4405 domain-containing protein [Persicirhabdus sediminis]|uniref:DUF4405 domain-containing protein n=1 Tax=Persicirhabdus sediminis TaxID=454144 RepID=A0A8J7MCA0_9BACT|nr:DUF4405 domain-containing protein [Persicirhabdus sediminis]MBK1789802.1 DUF4405 domain-containing protein [Persicirhabdus sediminis]